MGRARGCITPRTTSGSGCWSWQVAAGLGQQSKTAGKAPAHVLPVATGQLGRSRSSPAAEEPPPASSPAPGKDHPPGTRRADPGCSPCVLCSAAGVLCQLSQPQCRASVSPSLLCLLFPVLVGTVGKHHAGVPALARGTVSRMMCGLCSWLGRAGGSP